MSCLLFLTTDDFSLHNNGNATILSHDIKGFSLIMFYSNQCVHCQKLIPIFKRLPDIVNGCQFGMVNVNMNRSLINMSAESSTPIKYVPLIILYINGRPYMRYDGQHDENEIRMFILEVSNSIQEHGFQKILKENRIPSYAIGVPLYGDDVSYLEFDDAYYK